MAECDDNGIVATIVPVIKLHGDRGLFMLCAQYLGHAWEVVGARELCASLGFLDSCVRVFCTLISVVSLLSSLIQSEALEVEVL